MTKRLEDVKVVYEMDTEKNPLYIFSATDMASLRDFGMMSISKVFDMAKTLTNMVGEKDEMLRDFSNLDTHIHESEVVMVDTTGTVVFKDNKPVLKDSLDTEVSVGDIVYRFEAMISKSQLGSLEAFLWLRTEKNSYIKVGEVPGVAAMLLLQTYVKYLLDEIDFIEWHEPSYAGNLIRD